MLAGRYELTRVIGAGGMGLIMAARQLSMNREVAVKLIQPHALSDPKARARFEREVNIAKELAHPHIVQLIDFGEHDEVSYVVMELLQGENLHELIKREAPLEVGRALDILEQVLDALTVAHRRGVVHRDLKPPNIFVTPGSRERDYVKVLDFGIARPVEGSKHYVTTTGLISGTLPYMAPEVLTANELSESADVYAAGLVFLEMLYGKRIFNGENPTKMALEHMRKEVPIPEILRDSPIGGVIMKATAKRRDNRYKDADEFLAAVVEARGSLARDVVLDQNSIDAAFDAVDKDVIGDLISDDALSGGLIDSQIVLPVDAEDPRVTEQAERRPTGLIVAGVFVIGFVGIFAMMALSQDDGPDAQAKPEGTTTVQTEPADPAAAPDDPAAVDVFIDTEPSGAEVWIDGEHRFTTPVELGVIDKAGWEFKLDGYAPKRVVVGPDTPRLVVHLVAEDAQNDADAGREGLTANQDGVTTDSDSGETTRELEPKTKPRPKPKPKPKRTPGLVD